MVYFDIVGCVLLCCVWFVKYEVVVDDVVVVKVDDVGWWG